MKAILTYHSVDETGSVISVTPGELERHLDSLLSRKVDVVPLASLPLLPSDADAVAITFDDGFANFAMSALPLLVSRNITATVFVVPSYVGKVNSWEANDSRSPVPHLPLMTWGDINAVSAKGVDVGGHGLTHRSLRGLDPERLEMEVEDCFASIRDNLGKTPESFAFPYGDCDQAAIATVARRFAVACTTRFGLLRDSDSAHAMPRIEMFYFRGGRMLNRWGSPGFAAYLGIRKAGRDLGMAVRTLRALGGAR